jgi:hypothetical protein
MTKPPADAEAAPPKPTRAAANRILLNAHL